MANPITASIRPPRLPRALVMRRWQYLSLLAAVAATTGSTVIAWAVQR